MNFDHIEFVDPRSVYFKIHSDSNPNIHAHVHQCFELLLVVSGQMSVTVDGKTRLLCKDEAAFIFPYQIHQIKSEECSYKLFHFSSYVTISFASKRDSLVPETFCFQMPAALRDLFLDLKEEDGYYTKKGLTYMICEVFDKNRSYVPHKLIKNNLAIQMMIYIQSNFKNPQATQEMAEELGYDHAYLLRVFQKYTGIRFTEHVNLIRLQHACYLLEFSKFNILRCGEESGFSCARSFNRIFKEHFGRTPGEHRALFQK